jgi:hypothetical protein
MQFTVGGDRINYPGKVATPTAEILLAKMLFNGVISTKGAQFMTMDISNFYLMTPLHHAEFIQIKSSAPMRSSTNTSSERMPPKMAASTSKPSTHVWPPTSRIIGQQIPQKMPQQTWIPTKKISTWPLKTRHKINAVYTGC